MKFIISKRTDYQKKAYFFVTLQGNNGEPIMHSETYNSKSWATKIVNKMKKDVPNAEVFYE